MFNPFPHLDIIYEDDWFAVINKPANVLSVPGRGPDKQDSVLYRAEHLFHEAFPVHRLDEDVLIPIRTRTNNKIIFTIVFPRKS